MSDKAITIGCGLVTAALIIVSIVLVLLVSTYHSNFRARCNVQGGIVTQIGGSGKEVCLGPDLKIIEVSQW